MSDAAAIVACVSEELSGSEVPAAAIGGSPSQGVTPPPGGMRIFVQVLVNTMIANVTTSFLWFALTFWVYLETRSVLATGIIGGAYMLLIALFGIVFGTIVDRHRKHRVMVFASVVTLVSFVARRACCTSCIPESALRRPRRAVVLAVRGHHPVRRRRREHAQHRTVDDRDAARARRAACQRERPGRHRAGPRVRRDERVQRTRDRPARAWGGRSRSRSCATAVALVHLLFIRIPEEQPVADDRTAARSSTCAAASPRCAAAPGLFALILFSTFNNLIGGVYMALMDPYGLDAVPRRGWGVVLGVTATGFIIGGLVIAKWGLGRNPIRTMLLVVVVMGVLGALFTIREWWWLYAVGIWLYMLPHPRRRGVRADGHPEGRAVPRRRAACSGSRRRSSRRPRRSRRSSSHRSPSSGSSRTWSRRRAGDVGLAPRRGRRPRHRAGVLLQRTRTGRARAPRVRHALVSTAVAGVPGR